MKRILGIALVLALIVSSVFAMPVFAEGDGVAEKAVEKIIYGDLNGDALVNTKDVLLLRKYLAKWDVEIDSEAADTVMDDTINTKDLLVLRKKLAGYDVVLGHDYSETAYKMSEISEKITLVGRSKYIKSNLRADHTASGFEFRADCEGDVTIRFSIEINGGWLGVIVDDDYENMQETWVESYQTKLTVPGLEKGVHKIRVVKLNEFNIYSSGNHVTFKGVTLNGKVLKNKTEDKLKIEFYGDSLTCGYGNLCTNGTSGAHAAKYQNGLKTYAAYATRLLDAEMSVCSGSGYGVYCSNGGSTSQSVDDMINKAYFEDTDESKWDFSFDADVVVISLGTNDVNYAKSNGVKINDALIMEEAAELVDTIREHNPDCYILWIGGIAGKLTNDYCDIEGVVKQLAEKTENMVYYGDLPTSQAGGDGHPTVEQHEKLGALVAQLIKDNFPSVIE